MLKKLLNYLTSKKFVFNLLAIILVYVVGVWALKVYLNSKTHFAQKIEVPNLIGDNQNNIADKLMNAHLSFEVLDSIYDPTKVEGTIIEQDPMATDSTGIFVKENRVIRIRVSKRSQLVEMPDLVDKSQRFAESILINRNFRYKLEYQPSSEAHGAVIEQLYKGKSITPKTKLPIGSRITLIVGRDETGVTLVLPNLYGLTLNEAKVRVKNMGSMEFLPVCPDCVTSADSSKARVISQSPEFTEGGIVSSGTTISVYATKNFSE